MADKDDVTVSMCFGSDALIAAILSLLPTAGRCPAALRPVCSC